MLLLTLQQQNTFSIGEIMKIIAFVSVLCKLFYLPKPIGVILLVFFSYLSEGEPVEEI